MSDVTQSIILNPFGSDMTGSASITAGQCITLSLSNGPSSLQSNWSITTSPSSGTLTLSTMGPSGSTIATYTAASNTSGTITFGITNTAFGNTAVLTYTATVAAGVTLDTVGNLPTSAYSISHTATSITTSVTSLGAGQQMRAFIRTPFQVVAGVGATGFTGSTVTNASGVWTFTQTLGLPAAGTTTNPYEIQTRFASTDPWVLVTNSGGTALTYSVTRLAAPTLDRRARWLPDPGNAVNQPVNLTSGQASATVVLQEMTGGQNQYIRFINNSGGARLQASAQGYLITSSTQSFVLDTNLPTAGNSIVGRVQTRFGTSGTWFNVRRSGNASQQNLRMQIERETAPVTPPAGGEIPGGGTSDYGILVRDSSGNTNVLSPATRFMNRMTADVTLNNHVGAYTFAITNTNGDLSASTCTVIPNAAVGISGDNFTVSYSATGVTITPTVGNLTGTYFVVRY